MHKDIIEVLELQLSALQRLSLDSEVPMSASLEIAHMAGAITMLIIMLKDTE